MDIGSNITFYRIDRDAGADGHFWSFVETDQGTIMVNGRSRAAVADRVRICAESLGYSSESTVFILQCLATRRRRA
ncbi:hypothetical protein psal_cds_66 [Pandoravirus salinus]|uniref:Uncharacterized protein n=1 Tax=Pandoravirus salinus TaxID=1349410 RepID=S4VVP4_9VIRU|nr:hypothetical protein psal_cds_66 [Pandoravirus salinus]AGO83466.1 hypothetical protein psal_cds_66 [Pandoravirus salinus]